MAVDGIAFFLNRLGAFGTKDCIVTATGASWTYDDLLALAEDVFSDLPAFRMLVFVAGGNSVATLAAYLGALRKGHVVHMLDPGKNSENGRLVKAYRPNVVISCDGNIWSVARPNTAPLVLHPDLAVLLSTSGTTGTSKFVKLSYENVQANTDSIVEYLGLTGGDRAVTTLKPFYSYGFSVINTHFAVGGSLLLTELSLQDAALWDAMRTYGATNIPGVPYSFQMMRAMGADLSSLPKLRFLTQAGGKLAPALVKHFAIEARNGGYKFFVMYGQTEAAPRISYLPPDLAESYPSSIGMAVPGGRLSLLDHDGYPIEDSGVEGELVYSGPNVMVGYAQDFSGLGSKEDIAALRTGDLAIRNEADLFIITGRKSRFAKPFGLRISLDEVEAVVTERVGTAAVTSVNEEIFIIAEADETTIGNIAAILSTKYGLPETCFKVAANGPIPRLANGKTDYRKIQEGLMRDRNAPAGSFGQVIGFVRQTMSEFIAIVTGRTNAPASVKEAFQGFFGNRDLKDDDSFQLLKGDSMAYLQLALLLEEYLGYIPDNWQKQSLVELENLRRLETV